MVLADHLEMTSVPVLMLWNKMYAAMMILRKIRYRSLLGSELKKSHVFYPDR
jgi:hypothetical protein